MKQPTPNTKAQKTNTHSPRHEFDALNIAMRDIIMDEDESKETEDNEK